MKRILVTGSTGFIGSHLVKYLKERYKDEAVDILEFNSRLLLSGPLLNEYSEVDEIYHLAGPTGTRDNFISSEMLTDNILLMINLVKSFKKKRVKIVFTSTAEVGTGQSNIKYEHEDFPLASPIGWDDYKNPRWTYSFSKFTAEMILIHAAITSDFVYSIVRLSNVYGPGVPEKYVIGSFCKRVLENENPFVVKNPDDVRFFTYIDDVVDGLVKTMESSESDNNIINLAGSLGIRIDRIPYMLKSISGKKYGVDLEPNRNQIELRSPSISKAQSLLIWNPKTPFHEGLKKTYEWYKENYKSSPVVV